LNFWVSGSISFQYARISATADNLLFALYTGYGSTLIPGSAQYIRVSDTGIYTISFPPRLLQMSNGTNLDIRITPLTAANAQISILSMALSCQYAMY
jgi:hypothetical protein